MPKITKCLKCLKLMYPVDFKLEIQDWELFNFLDFFYPYAQHRSFIKMMERSDTIILGILGTLGIFRFIRVRE